MNTYLTFMNVIGKRVLIVFPLALITVFCLIVSCAGQQPATSQAGTRGRTTTVTKLEPIEAHALIQKNRGNPSFVIIDIRTPEEYASGHIEGAVNINYHSETFVPDLGKLDKETTYLVYCRTGRRTSDTVGIMVRLGFTTIYRFNGDILRWKAEGLPVVKP
jgi:rhodanese-related sulfurtransferase